MQILESEFGFAHHWLKAIWRQGDVALYERCLSKDKPAHELELVIIKIKPEGKTPSGSIVYEREAYPSASEWGTSGWSFPVGYKEWVLSLAEKLLGISKARPSFMRQAQSEFKAAGLLSR